MFSYTVLYVVFLAVIVGVAWYVAPRQCSHSAKHFGKRCPCADDSAKPAFQDVLDVLSHDTCGPGTPGWCAPPFDAPRRDQGRRSHGPTRNIVGQT